MNTQLDRNNNDARWARYRRAAGVILSTLLVVPGVAVSAAPPTGLKVMLQPWDPKTDDDSVKTVVDSPDLISSELSKTWAQSKPDIIEAIKQALGKGDMIAKGVTLYDININLNEPALRIEPGPGDALKATFTLPDSSFEASATQPTVAGKWADPRCSVRFTLDVTFAFRVTDTPSRLFQSAYGPNDRPVTVRDFSADSQNLTCDIAKAILSVTGLWQMVTNMVNDPNLPQYRKLNDGLRRGIDAALATINSRVVVPAQYVRLKMWPGSSKTTVLLGVREVPVPPAQLRVAAAAGRVTVGDLKGLTLPIQRCDQLAATAQVKTGPRPVLTPTGTEFGDPPMHNVDGVRMTGSALGATGAVRATQPGSQAGQSCDYTLQGLVPGFPNFVAFRVAGQIVPNPKSPTPNLRDTIDVVPQGWRFDEALHPLPKVDGRNLTLLAQMHGSAGYAAKQEVFKPLNPGDPAQRISDVGSRILTQPAAGQTAAKPSIGQAVTKPASSLATTASTYSTTVQNAAKTPQWGTASMIPHTSPATSVSQSVTQASPAVSSSALKAPTSAFIR